MATKGASNHYGNARGGRQGHITAHTGFAWAKDFNKHSLVQHVDEHMKSLGLGAVTDYVAHAVKFANFIDRDNHVSYIRPNGQTVKFSKKTGELVIVDKRGYVTTYFKPDRGYAYYLDDRRKRK
jgi:pyocin large subunit-like protein